MGGFCCKESSIKGKEYLTNVPLILARSYDGTAARILGPGEFLRKNEYESVSLPSMSHFIIYDVQTHTEWLFFKKYTIFANFVKDDIIVNVTELFQDDHETPKSKFITEAKRIGGIQYGSFFTRNFTHTKTNRDGRG